MSVGAEGINKPDVHARASTRSLAQANVVVAVWAEIGRFKLQRSTGRVEERPSNVFPWF